MKKNVFKWFCIGYCVVFLATQCRVDPITMKPSVEKNDVENRSKTEEITAVPNEFLPRYVQNLMQDNTLCQSKQQLINWLKMYQKHPTQWSVLDPLTLQVGKEISQKKWGYILSYLVSLGHVELAAKFLHQGQERWQKYPDLTMSTCFINFFHGWSQINDLLTNDPLAALPAYVNNGKYDEMMALLLKTFAACTDEMSYDQQLIYNMKRIITNVFRYRGNLEQDWQSQMPPTLKNQFRESCCLLVRAKGTQQTYKIPSELSLLQRSFRKKVFFRLGIPMFEYILTHWQRVLSRKGDTFAFPQDLVRLIQYYCAPEDMLAPNIQEVLALDTTHGNAQQHNVLTQLMTTCSVQDPKAATHTPIQQVSYGMNKSVKVLKLLDTLLSSDNSEQVPPEDMALLVMFLPQLLPPTKQHQSMRWAVLHQAALKGIVPIFKAMLTDEDAQRKEAGFTLLHLAACKGQRNIMRLLGAPHVDANARSSQNDTPLHFIVMNKSLPADKIADIRYLRALGADTTLVNDDGLTPLALAHQIGITDSACLAALQ